MKNTELNRFKLLLHLSSFKKPTEVKLSALRKEYKIGSISIFIELLSKTSWIQKKKKGNKTFIKWIGEGSPDEKLVKFISIKEKEILKERYPYLYDKKLQERKRKENKLQKSGEAVGDLQKKAARNNEILNNKIKEGVKEIRDLNFKEALTDTYYDKVNKAPLLQSINKKLKKKEEAPQLFLELDDITDEEQLKREALQRLKIRLLTELSSISAEFQKKIKELSREISKISLLLLLGTIIFSSCGSNKAEEAFIDPVDTLSVKFTSFEIAPDSIKAKYEEFEAIISGDIKTDILSKEQRAEIFAVNYYKTAQEEEHKYGIPSSITLAQGILESSSGCSKLALNNNNLFGIKCFSRKCKKGHCTNLTDDSHKDFFKVYPSVWYSFRDHSDFLQGSRYKPLKKCKNYKEYARGLQSCGYATDPNYAKSLISIIQKYELFEYDLKK